MNKNSSIITNSYGNSKIIGIFFILAVVSAIYLSYTLLPHYLNYLSFKDLAGAKISAAQIMKDENILNDLYNKAKELNLPLEKEDIIVKREDGRLHITAEWEVEVEFIGGYKKTLKFSIDAGG
ncbi:MAG: hypothetical protein HZA05_01375 [Nitrospirae bacterium]|nr:hypothetical protein [Nitrospirota bacterium]